MGNLDLINLSLNMNHFPSITISTFPEEKPTTIMPAIYALSKDPNAFAHSPLLAKIADRFKQINQQQNEDFIKEMTTSLPLSNANLQPDPSKVSSDFTRHVLDLIRKNEKMIAKGLAPINLVETEIVKLRPSKRKFFMVQLMKQAAKENKLKNQDCLELGVHRSEVEKILKSSTKPEIIRRLNYYHKKMERSRRNNKRVNTLNLTESMQPSVMNLESHCNMEHVHDHSCHLEVNEPRKSCYQVNHLNNVRSNTDIWIPKELIADDDICTDSSSCASIKSPCKRDNDNLSSLSGASPNNRGCKDFKLVMAKKMQRAKMAMKQELESDSESEDMYNEIESFAPRRDSGELKMLSFPSTKTNSVNSVYNKERLSAMKKGSQRKLKRGFSTHLLGSNSQMSSISQVGGTNMNIKLPSMTSLHDIVEEKTPKENDDVNADLDEKIDKIIENKGVFGYAGNVIKNISNLHIGSNFVNSRNVRMESNSNESSLSSSPIKKANSPTRTVKASLPPKAPMTKRLPTSNGIPKRVPTKTKSFVIRTQSRESSIDRTLLKKDSIVTESVRPSKKKPSTQLWNLAPTLNRFNVEKKELSSFITDTKNYYNFNMTQKDCFKLKLAQNTPKIISKESSIIEASKST